MGKINILIEKYRSEEIANLKMVLDDIEAQVTDKALKIRNNSRILNGAFVFHCLTLKGAIICDEASENVYFEAINRCFTLGYISVKNYSVIRGLDVYDNKISGLSLNDEWTVEEYLWCARLADGSVTEKNKKDIEMFFNKYGIIEDFLKALIQQIMILPNKDITDEMIASKLASCYVGGYAAAECPKMFKKL